MGPEPRIERANSALSPEFLSEEERGFYPSLPSKREYSKAVWMATKDEPSDGLTLIFERDLGDVITNFNKVLLFRVLKGIYEDPDFLVAPAKRTSKTKFTVLFAPKIDWGYCLKVNEYLTVEVRSRFGNERIILRFWHDPSFGEPDEEEVFVKDVLPFAESLEDIYWKNTNLFEEKNVLKNKEGMIIATINIFSERYQAGEKLFEFAKDLDKPLGMRVAKIEQEIPKWTLGYINLSAASMFCVALEALINTMYHFLLKPEFVEKEDQKRVLLKSGIEFLLVSIHLFCQGFVTPPVPAHSELWRKFIKMRSFRNEVFHGNVTEEHEYYTIYEKPVMFTYMPAKEFRGEKAEKMYERTYPPSMSNVGPEVVAEIKAVVDEIVAVLLNAMDDPTRQWVTGWLHESFIPRRT